MRRARGLGGKLFLLVSSTALTLVVMEAAARIYLTRFASDAVFNEYASFDQLQSREDLTPLYVPHRYLGFSPGPEYTKGENRHNALGFRGEEIAQPKPPGRFRIACIGGSTTYTVMVEDHRRSYPAQLQAELERLGHGSVEVINAGVGSWSTWESLINLQFRLLDLEPDLLIIYHAINDVHSRLVWPPKEYVGDNSGYRPASSSLFAMGTLEHSTLARAAMIRSGLATPHRALVRSFDVPGKSSFKMHFMMQVRRGTYPKGIFRKVSAKRMLEVNGPTYFRRNLSNMVAIGEAHGIPSVVATFAYSKHFPEEPSVAAPEYRAALDEMNDVVRDIAAETDAILFDFAAVFPDEEANYVDGRHLNEQGAASKARLFAEFLDSQELIPRLPSSFPWSSATTKEAGP